MHKKNKNSITSIILPKIGESITKATIINWFVHEGDMVKEGTVLLEVSTDKVNSEIPAPAHGKVIAIEAQVDDEVEVGQVIGKIDTSFKALSKEPIQNNEKQSETLISKNQKAQKKKQENRTSATAAPQDEYIIKGRSNSQFFSPLVEKIARKKHISYQELARIPGTGRNNRLQKSDVFNYIEAGRPAQFTQYQTAAKTSGFQVPKLEFNKGKGRIVEMDRMGQMIADHMVFSKIVSPHVTAYVEVDMTAMANWRKANKEAFQKKYHQKLTFTPLFIEAVAQALQDYPKINSSIDGDKIIVKEGINIGVGAALPTGNIIVPVIKNANRKSLKTLAAETNNLVEKARNNQLKADDIQGGTFTISNVGTFGSVMGTPVINQPEAAILATGLIKKRAEVMEYKEGDTIEIRQMMYLCLSFDHSFIDGQLAGKFLRRTADYLENFTPDRKI